MIEFDIKLTTQDMYRFNLYQSYTGSQGWVSIFSAILVFSVPIRGYATMETSRLIMNILLGLLLLVYLPITLYISSKQSFAKNSALREMLHYCVDEMGIHVTQGEASAELKWEQIYKIVATKSNVLIYSNRVNAYVIPREQLGELYTPLAELANAQLPKHCVKMR